MLLQTRLRFFLLAASLAALAMAGNAYAKGGNYVITGGTDAERATVKAALDVSAVDWSIVPVRVEIRIYNDIENSAGPGRIWLDAALLHSGVPSWGLIQHEYGHQIDYFLLDGAERAFLRKKLRGKAWWPGAQIPHRNAGAERFASTLAWSYWQSGQNSLKPDSKYSESAAMKPAKFRALMRNVLGIDPLEPRAGHARKALVTDAEIRSDDGDVSAPEYAGRARDVDYRDADATKRPPQEVRPVLGTVGPGRDDAARCQQAGRPEQVLADLPVATLPCIEALDPLRELGAVERGVAEISASAHLPRVLSRRLGERSGELERL